MELEDELDRAVADAGALSDSLLADCLVDGLQHCYGLSEVHARRLVNEALDRRDRHATS